MLKTPLLSVLIVGMVGFAFEAHAVPQVEFELVDDCNNSGDNCGPRGENDGPGFEQAVPTWWQAADGSTWVSLVTMTAKGVPNRANAPYQCRYDAWKVDAVQGPRRMVSNKLLTANVGDRPCNHPYIEYAGDNQVLFCYGTNDANNANVQWYCQGLNAETGVALANRTRLSDNNGNDGAGRAAFFRNADGGLTFPKTFSTCYNDNGNNADCTIATLNANGSVALQTRIADVIDPANIPRPFMTQIGPDTQVVCAAKGDQRPPEDGAYCRVITKAGQKVGVQQALMRSNLNASPRVYANSPEIHPGPTPGTFWALNTTTDGRGRNTNNKGTSNLYAHVIAFPDNKLTVMSTLETGHYLTHASMCTGSYGPDGVAASAIIESSITNSGPPTILPLTYDPATAKISEGSLKVTSAYTGDSGYLANIYGNNPNNQGRDFVTCIGSVENPGYGLPTGWMNETKTLFVSASYGKMTQGDYKNSLFISFIPGHTPNVELPPDEPPPDNGGDDTPPGGGDDGSNPDPGNPKSGSTGGCSAASSSTGSLAGLILMLGAFVLVTRRRR
jgi:hypothetical protein